MSSNQGYMLDEQKRDGILNKEIDQTLREKFERYRAMFAFDFYQIEIEAEQFGRGEHTFLTETRLEEQITGQGYSDENIHLSLAEALLFSKVKEIQSIVKARKGDIYEYIDLLPEFLENNELLSKDINEKNVSTYDYFFIQALLSHLKKMLVISYERNEGNYVAESQIEYIAQVSIVLAESYSDFSVSYKAIELTKDSQYDQLERITEGANDFIYSLGELSNLTSKSEYVEALLTKLKSQYLVMSAAEDDFNNLFEYLGYLQYIGNDHFLYEMGMNELENEIINQLRALALPDIVFLLEDDIYPFVDDSDLEFQGWSHLRKCIYSSDEFDRLVRSIKNEFLRMAPEYFPE